MRKHAPLLAALACLAIALASTLARSLERTEGGFVYALDDTYIHMALSRSLAEHGVWGIDGRTFASCSSSPLWTLLLAAAFKIAGVHAFLPALLAGLFAAGILAAAHFWLRASGAAPWPAFAILAAIVLATPLVPLVFVANEHATHALLTLGFAACSIRALTEGEWSSRSTATLAALAALTVGARYEGLFLVAAAAVLLAVRRRWRPALAAAGGGALPVLAFGGFSLLEGGSFLPNSVLMKAKYPFLGLEGKILAFSGPSVVSEILKTPELALLVAGAAFLLAVRLRRSRTLWEPVSLALALFVAASLLHMDFARTGEFYRYEAYLVAFGVLATGLACVDRTVARGRAVAITSLVALALIPRGVTALRDTPVATGNIHEQQVQTATFLRDHYRGAAVAVNDIGLAAFLADVRVVDLWGLANAEVAEARRLGTYGPDVIRSVADANGADVAVVFQPWFERFGGLPDSWVRVGEWTIPDNVVSGSPVVSFFATRKDAVDRLASSLRSHASRLPARVRQSGAYVEGP